MIIFDTNIVSEIMRKRPENNVVDRLNNQGPAQLLFAPGFSAAVDAIHAARKRLWIREIVIAAK